MRAILAICLFAVAASALSEGDYQFLFTRWVAEHGRVYEFDQVFARYNQFKANLDLIAEHNAGNASWTMGMNQFGDMNGNEFKATVGGCLLAPREAKMPATQIIPSDVNDAVDWRTKGAVTPVKDQKQCGSCWAFSATGAIEGRVQIATSKLVSVSEQQLVDCAGSAGNQGCNGGLMSSAFTYLIGNKGSNTEEGYPYTARDGQCKKLTPLVSQIKSQKDVAKGNEAELVKAIQDGPVSVAIEADQSVFQFYKSGVLDDKKCGTQLDHGVLAVGYDTDATSKKDYYIVKNSWGASWGNNGYIWLVRNKNQCGIAQMNTYPIV
jgi:cathepsin L